ncbi:hypothetical protein B0H19DRAFT_1147912 [Mycena capillaripes]|nr:hypothetical protein B0H19DRAFT_1147912 [Mycena capillaripes]
MVLAPNRLLCSSLMPSVWGIVFVHLQVAFNNPYMPGPHGPKSGLLSRNVFAFTLA